MKVRYMLIIFGLLIGYVAADRACDAACEANQYRSYSVISASLANLAINNTPVARVFTIGTTAEGRDIQAILITQGANNASGSGPTLTTGKPAVVITGGIHANEWVGVEVAMGVAEYLVENRASTDSRFEPAAAQYKNLTVKNLLEKVEIVIVPVLNPDGYVYSQTGDMGKGEDPQNPGFSYNYWRKNRRDTSDQPQVLAGDGLTVISEAGEPGDVGIDLNRNFPVGWDSATCGHAIDPSSYSTYRGPYAASERETNLLMNVIESRHAIAAIDYHAGATMVLYPFAYNYTSSTGQYLRPNTRTYDGYLFDTVARRIAGYISSSYSVGLTMSGSPTCGTARDWSYSEPWHTAGFNIEVSSDSIFQPFPFSGICKENISGALWLMFWAGDQGFRQKRTILEDEQIKDRRLKIRSTAVPVEP